MGTGPDCPMAAAIAIGKDRTRIEGQDFGKLSSKHHTLVIDGHMESVPSYLEKKGKQFNAIHSYIPIPSEQDSTNPKTYGSAAVIHSLSWRTPSSSRSKSGSTSCTSEVVSVCCWQTEPLRHEKTEAIRSPQGAKLQSPGC